MMSGEDDDYSSSEDSYSSDEEPSFTIVSHTALRTLLSYTIPLQLVFHEELYPFVPPYKYERWRKPQETDDHVVADGHLGDCIDLLMGLDDEEESKSETNVVAKPETKVKPTEENKPFKSLVFWSASIAGLAYIVSKNIDKCALRYSAGAIASLAGSLILNKIYGSEYDYAKIAPFTYLAICLASCAAEYAIATDKTYLRPSITLGAAIISSSLLSWRSSAQGRAMSESESSL